MSRSQPARARGFTFFEFSVAALVLSALAVIFYDKLLFYQEQSEKAAMERTIDSIESALRMRHAQLFSMDRAGDVAILAASNPVDWLLTKPANYLGLRAGPLPDGGPRGVWYFDPGRRQLVYVVKHDRHLKYPAREIAFQVVQNLETVPKGNAQSADKLAYGVSFRAIEPYQWL